MHAIWARMLSMKMFPLMMLLVLPCVAADETQPQVPTQTEAVDIMSMKQDARCHQVVVTCLVNGAPMRMMLDTGATHTVLHEESAARVPQAHWVDTSKMKFRGNSSQQPKLLLANLQTGPAESENHPVMVMNLGAVRSMMAEAIDGIIGMDLLGQLPFTFDMRSKECYWGIPTGGEFVPLYAAPDGKGRFIVQARCQGKPVHMLLDTGSSVTRVFTAEWTPGKGKEIGAQIGDIDSATGIKVLEGNPGDMELGPGVSVQGVTPILCEPNDVPMLGMDGLKGAVLIHVPTAESPSGAFFLLK